MSRYQRGQLFATKSAYFLRFYQTQPDGTRKQKAVKVCDRHGRTKGDARKLAAPILDQVNNGFRTTAADITIAAFVKDTFKPWYDAEKKPSTASSYDRIWKCYLQLKVSNVPMGEFRTSDGSRILTEFARSGLGRSTVHHIRAFLSKMFGIAVSKGIVSSNPINKDCVMLASPATPEPTVEYSADDVQRMIAAVDDVRGKAAIALCYYGLMRPGEARGLKWSDYNGVELAINRSVWGTKIGTTKTGGGRVIPTIEPLGTILKELRASQPHPLESCYILSGDIQPLNLDNLGRRVIKPALEKAGIKSWRSYYPARRGMSSLALTAGADTFVRMSNVLTRF